jgi:hypothetical protein
MGGGGTYTKRNIASAIFHSTDIPDVYDLLFPFLQNCLQAERTVLVLCLLPSYMKFLYRPWRHMWEVAVYLHSFLTLVLVGVVYIISTEGTPLPPQYPLPGDLVGPRDSIDVSENRKIPCPCWGLNPSYPARNLVTICTKLSRIPSVPQRY